jgi:Protein of unknown function (DUF3073)
MGRGRAKAKQTKVARELKYSSGGTDLERLRAELTVPGARPANGQLDDDLATDEDDTHARAGDEDDEDDDDR